MKKDDAKDIIKKLFHNREETKYPHPDWYSNLVKCMSDYRHIKKDQRRFFSPFNGSRNYINCTPYRGKLYKQIGPSVLYACRQEDPVPLNVHNRIYAIVVMARDNVSSTMTEFEFMRPLIVNKDQTKIKPANYFECVTRTMYASSKPSDEGCITHRDKSRLNEQDVCWAVTDLIHELCSVNMEPSRNGIANWRNGLEIIIQYHVFSKNMVGHWYNFDANDDDIVDRTILSKVDIYNLPVCGYTNSNNSFKFEFPLTIIQA